MIGASCVSHDTGKGARYNEVGGPKDGTSNYKMAVKLAGYSQSQYAMHLEASFLVKN